MQFKMSCPYTSQRNGRVERKGKHIVEVWLIVVAEAKIPSSYWWEALSTITCLIIRLPSLVTQNEILYSLIHKNKLDYNSLKRFGCDCYTGLKSYDQDKLHFHTTRCVFLAITTLQRVRVCHFSLKRIHLKTCSFQ